MLILAWQIVVFLERLAGHDREFEHLRQESGGAIAQTLLFATWRW